MGSGIMSLEMEMAGMAQLTVQEQQLADLYSPESLESAGLSPPVGQFTLIPAGHSGVEHISARDALSLPYPFRASSTPTSNTIWQVCACGSAATQMLVIDTWAHCLDQISTCYFLGEEELWPIGILLSLDLANFHFHFLFSFLLFLFFAGS